MYIKLISLEAIKSATKKFLQVIVTWVSLALYYLVLGLLFWGIYIFAVYQRGRFSIVVICVTSFYYFLSPQVRSCKHEEAPLTEEKFHKIFDSWTPEPLVPALSEDMQGTPPELESAAGPHTKIKGKSVVNFASANYLGLIGHEKILDSCTSSLEKYGVGSCGPRGFYGTMDEHLECEAKVAKFLGTPDSIVYSYGLSSLFSTIPFFCKKGHVIVADEGVHWGIQNGLLLSRSKVLYFKHNDMASLESILAKITSEKKPDRKIRGFIVIEALYQNSGQIAPLNDIIALKEKFAFRLFMDESNSFGVLGHSGRGLTEYYGMPIEKIDVVTAAMGHSLAAEGGFCTGGFCFGSTRFIDDHRLLSDGYVYSASLPPYLATAARTAINLLEENPDLITKLKENIALLWAGLSGFRGLQIVSNPHSPIVFMKLDKSTGCPKSDSRLLEYIADQLLQEHNVFVAVSKRSTVDQCPLPIGIRLFISAGHSESDIRKACKSLKIVCASIIKEPTHS